jgi:hypothetical protein
MKGSQRMDIETVKERIKANEYKVKRNQKPGLTSEVWETLFCIYDAEMEPIEHYLFCTQCNDVITKPGGSSTKNLLTHTKNCSLKNKEQSMKQTTIGFYCNYETIGRCKNDQLL